MHTGEKLDKCLMHQAMASDRFNTFPDEHLKMHLHLKMHTGEKFKMPLAMASGYPLIDLIDFQR